MSFVSTYSAASINGYRNFENNFGVVQTLQPQDIASDMFFGAHVAINSTGSVLAIISNPSEFVTPAPGSCYIFTGTPGTYTQQQKIYPATGNYTGFGTSVALNGAGNTLAVGSYTSPTGSIPYNGNVYIFTSTANVFTQQQVLRGSDSQNNDQFGRSIALNSTGDYCIVSATNWDGSFSNQGAAYIFYRSGGVWTQQQRLDPSPATVAAEFGSSVAISNDGTYAVVSSKAPTKGSVYVYTRSGTVWTLQQKITFTALPYSAEFYDFVSINDTNDRIIIGPASPGTAPVLYYSRTGSTWSLTTTIDTDPGQTSLISSTNRPLNKFISQNFPVNNLYSYNGANWVMVQSLNPVTGPPAINDAGNIYIGGGPSYDTPASNIGIVYVWSL
jgi:hypothetical protein